MRPAPLICLLALSSCASPHSAEDGLRVQTWGSMRRVMRDGESEGRVVPVDHVVPQSIGVGALAGLSGEVTVRDGRVLVARAPIAPGGRPTLEEGTPSDQATLLVLAQVGAWGEIPLGRCADFDALEQAIAQALAARGIDGSEPVPVKVRGRAPHLAFHVIAGACPIANPNGPAPWRYAGPLRAVELLGFYVEGAVGRLTHHGRRSHLHAWSAEAGGLMGHLDAVTLEDSVLLLPAAVPGG